MKPEKRSRGRPKGTCKDDRALLQAVADKRVANPRYTTTTALRRVMENPTDADVRRVQAKWKVDGDQLLAQAEERARAKDMSELVQPAPVRSARATVTRDNRLAMTELVRRVIDDPVLAQVREAVDGPLREQALAALNNPALRQVQEAMSSPVMQEVAKTMAQVHQALDAPAMKAARELYDSPAVRQAQELVRQPAVLAAMAGANEIAQAFYDSPAGRLARDPKLSQMLQTLQRYGL